MLLGGVSTYGDDTTRPGPAVRQTCWLMEGLWRGASEWLIELRTSSAMFWWNGREDKRLCQSAADMPVKCCGEWAQEGFLMKRLHWRMVGVPAWMILCGSLSGLSLFGSCSLSCIKKKKKHTGRIQTPSRLHCTHHLTLPRSKLQLSVWLLIKFNLTLP